ncbi:MAG: hypothetical protein K5656_06720 [Lachnospiraceae bacterium]|nr:hypothetical protein [Lachnospiraceae bacterium]
MIKLLKVLGIEIIIFILTVALGLFLDFKLLMPEPSDSVVGHAVPAFTLTFSLLYLFIIAIVNLVLIIVAIVKHFSNNKKENEE